MRTLIRLNTFMKYNKFNTHTTDNIRWCKFINPVLLLQKITRDYITDILLNVYLSEDDINKLQTKDKNKNLQYDVRIIAFDIHHKIIGNGNGSEGITTKTYPLTTASLSDNQLDSIQQIIHPEVITGKEIDQH